MIIVLLAIGGILLLIGAIFFLVDAFKVHWGWGLGTLLPGVGALVALICVCINWSTTKRGFLLSLLALLFLGGAAFSLTKPKASDSSAKIEKINDPFFNAMQKARAAVVQVEQSRQPETETAKNNVLASIAPSNNPPAVTPAPAVLSYAQRLAKNRAAFKALEGDFAALNAKRQALSKKDKNAIAAFNLEAKAYADKLAETRSEQSILLELQRTASK